MNNLSDDRLINLGYRKLVCDIIHQAISWSNGIGLSGALENLNPNSNYFKQEKEKEIKEARKFIFSEDFVFYCELLGIDDQVKTIRSKTPKPAPLTLKYKKIRNKKKLKRIIV